ncbi:MAG TPA: hypothetical protein VFL86_02415 [Burkholderiaceae bacterium]|nr:hypothetical protein [Burkholderiaceae bacterium]
MRTNKHMWRLAALSAVVVALAGCGNGDDDNPPPPPPADEVPAAALVSTQSFVAFLQGLAPNDTIEPLKLNGGVPPVSETEEPVEIN